MYSLISLNVLPQQIFIDRDPAAFGYILNYLRTKELNLHGVDVEALRHEAEFYGIGPLGKNLVFRKKMQVILSVLCLPDFVILHGLSTLYRCSLITNAAVNGHLELPLLKDCQRFDTISTSNLEIYNFRWLVNHHLFIFGHGESLPNNIWSMVNLEQTCVFCFTIFFVWKWILT